MTEEMCKDCPWKNRETCGACRADKERRKLDKVEIKSVELQVEEVKKLINEGKNYKEIAKMLNVEYNKLYYFINKNNLNPSKPKKKSKERKKTKNKEDIGDIP